MEIIHAYFRVSSENVDSSNCGFTTLTYAISEWYCKPSILSSLAYKFNKTNSDCLFITCTKYGCRQFLPKQFKSFPVHNITEITYKENLPWIVLEFNDYAITD